MLWQAFSVVAPAFLSAMVELVLSGGDLDGDLVFISFCRLLVRILRATQRAVDRQDLRAMERNVLGRARALFTAWDGHDPATRGSTDAVVLLYQPGLNAMPHISREGSCIRVWKRAVRLPCTAPHQSCVRVWRQAPNF